MIFGIFWWSVRQMTRLTLVHQAHGQVHKENNENIYHDPWIQESLRRPWLWPVRIFVSNGDSMNLWSLRVDGLCVGYGMALARWKGQLRTCALRMLLVEYIEIIEIFTIYPYRLIFKQYRFVAYVESCVCMCKEQCVSYIIHVDSHCFHVLVKTKHHEHPKLLLKRSRGCGFWWFLFLRRYLLHVCWLSTCAQHITDRSCNGQFWQVFQGPKYVLLHVVSFVLLVDKIKISTLSILSILDMLVYLIQFG